MVRGNPTSVSGETAIGDAPDLSRCVEDGVFVVVSVRRPRQEERRVVRKHVDHRGSHDVRKLVVLDPVPDIEDEVSTPVI